MREMVSLATHLFMTTLTPATVARAYMRKQCERHPAEFLKHVKCQDTRTGERFEFQLTDADDPWYWQREEVLDWWIDNKITLILKARQLGITWLAAGYALWHLLFQPGTRTLIYSIGEEESSIVIGRIWQMFLSLHDKPFLTEHVTLMTPKAADTMPSEKIMVRHEDGRISSIRAMAATKAAGHSETAALVILDEVARQQYAKEIHTAVIPVIGEGGGRLIGISTGNGMSGGRADKGNFFHYWWSNKEQMNTAAKFLRWDRHPNRDQEWYDRVARALPDAERGEQYPMDELEAFILTGSPYFDRAGIQWYRQNAMGVVKFQGMFMEQLDKREGRSARFKVSTGASWIKVFREPRKGGLYAIGVDTSTGTGEDYTSAHVIDLSTMEIVATLHAKINHDLASTQLHYLGKWYNTARICIDRTGGYGEALIADMLDSREGRPRYQRMYIHQEKASKRMSENVKYGFPISHSTRPKLCGNIERAIRDHLLPFIPYDDFAELITFVNAEHAPTPRAQEGCNDDRVFSLGLALEMHARYGSKHKRPLTDFEQREADQLKARRHTWYDWSDAVEA